MANAAHTPGPWRYAENGEVTTAEPIAAAPELLKSGEALITRRDFWDAVRAAGIAIPGEFDDLSDAIAEAKGGAS